MVQDEQEKWDIVIKPRSGLFRLDLEEVWRYRDGNVYQTGYRHFL